MSGAIESVAQFLREHPYLVSYVLVGAIVGAAATVWYDVGPAHIAGKIIGGAVAGGGAALFPMGARMFE